MKKIESYGHIKDGKLKISYRQTFDEMIKRAEDCRVRVTVEKLYKRRTSKRVDPDTGEETKAQNGYYWGVVVHEFCQGFFDTYGTFITKKDAHEFLKSKFNVNEFFNEKTGEVIQVPMSTATLTTVQFEEYLIKCREFIEEWFGIRVALPNEQTSMSFDEKEKPVYSFN